MTPLYVDLDGTLYPGDTLHDSVMLHLQGDPWSILSVGVAMARGPVMAKAWLAERVLPNPVLLPYRTELIDWISSQRASGRRVVLATAAHVRIAEAVAKHLGCFDAVIATDSINRKGAVKLAAIQADAQGPFVYAGDCAADLPIWKAAEGAVLTGPAATWPETRIGCPVIQRFPSQVTAAKAFIKAIRPHQWVKNVLVFLPLLAGHVTAGSSWLAALAMFAAFCGCASSVYLLNDLLDLENDRAHPRKRRRPFAAGTLPIMWGVVAGPLLLLVAGILAWLVSWSALAILSLYYAATVAYSFELKRRVLLDVFVLAGLYVIRAVAGAVAVSVPMSPWLMAVLVFLFLSLALGKRAAELHGVQAKGDSQAKGRGWRVEDLPFVTTGGIAAAFATALVVGLYVAGPTAPDLYRQPTVLWGLVPLILWWSCRVWLKAGRGELHDDPIVFAIKDRGSWIMVLLAIGLILAASPKGSL